MLLKFYLSFTFLLADLAWITSIFFDPDPLSIFVSASLQMPLGFPRRHKLLVAFRTLFVIGCVQQRIIFALLSQHFLNFLVRVCLIRLF